MMRLLRPALSPALRRIAALAAVATLLLVPGGPGGAGAQEVPPPAMSLAVASYAPVPVNFGFVSVRTVPPSVLVSVRNLGSDDLVVSALTPSDPTLTVDVASLPAIPAGGTAAFRITYDPVAAGALDAAITVTSNDAFIPTYSLPVRGTGVDVSVTVAPDERILVPGQRLTFAASVTGASDPSVTWSLAGAGSINVDGTYTAPADPGTAVVRATSVLDPETTGTASVLVVSPEVAVGAEPDLGLGRFGGAIATGDLDGDGFAEVAVAAPDADVDTPGGVVTGAGAVWIRTFGAGGFTGPVTRLVSPAPVAGGGFGSALLMRDLNADGRIDLAVGEPGGDGAVPGTGTVHYFAGDGAGGFEAPDAPVTTAPAGLAAGARFGAALAAGYFGGDGPPLLAVGAPGADVGGDPQAGTVHVVDPVAGAAVAVVTAPAPETAAAFGTAVRSACLDACTAYGGPDAATERLQVNDLVVGAPGATVTTATGALAEAGRVFAFPFSGDPGDPFAASWEVEDPVPAAGARFGTALATGDLNGSVTADVAVGAPGQPAVTAGAEPGAGMVFTFLSDGFGAFAPLDHLYDRTPAGGAGFGSVVALRDLNGDGRVDLTVGTPAPGGDGHVTAYYGAGGGDFGSMRLFPAPAEAAGGRFGTALAWVDLNLDGRSDLLAGAPDASVDGTADRGALHVHLDLPPAAITVSPARVVLARRTLNAQTVAFIGSVPPESAVWSVLAGPGRVNTSGIYTSDVTPGGPLSDDVVVGLRTAANPNHWALAHVQHVGALSSLYSPDVIINDDGVILLSSQPEAGAQFGSAIQVVDVGRQSTDPYPGLPSVLASFPSVSSVQLPRVPRFPFDADPTAPFTSIQFYFGQPSAARTGWGSQIAGGDFDGDGNADFAVSAPYAPSSDSSEVQVGFVDLYLLGDTGLIKGGGVIRLGPTPSMLAPDGRALWLGTDARSNARYGYRLLAHDLNGDGRDDLIVGMPHADLCTAASASQCEGVAGAANKLRDAGVVEVLLAPPSGDWTQGVVRATVTEETPRAGGYFGGALAVGDLTGDDVPELFVGAPGRDPQGLETALNTTGVVHGVAPANWNQATSEGLRAALAAAERLVIADPQSPPAGYYNGFGMSLRLADFDPADAADELAVGAPYRILVDPARRDLALVPLKHETGGVDLYDGDGGLTERHLGRVLPPVRQTGMRFGERIVAARLHGPDAPLSLVVSAPFFDTAAGPNAGAVFVFDGTGGPMPRYRMTITPPQEAALDQFGQALEAGDVDLDGTDEILASAPNASISQVIGYQVFPSRHRGPEPVIATSEHAGKVYVIFPELP